MSVVNMKKEIMLENEVTNVKCMCAAEAQTKFTHICKIAEARGMLVNDKKTGRNYEKILNEEKHKSVRI